MKDRVRHHYVPRHYLQGFTKSPNSEQIWVYEKGKNKRFRVNLNKAGVEKHYYTLTNSDDSKDSNTIEDWLAQEIEGPANTVLNKIRMSKPITDQEKFVLSVYMYVMIKRVPDHIPHSLSIYQGVCEELIDEIKQGNVPKKFLDNYTQAEMIAVAENMKYNYNSKNIYLSSVPQLSEKIITAIYKMTWKFLTFSGEREFITCDNPLCFDRGIGIGKEQSEITFPLSTHITLWASWQNDFDKKYYQTDQVQVDIINSRTKQIATKYLYYYNNTDWIDKIPYNTTVRRS